MKLLILALAALVLNSCNTSIGLYRDTKVAYHWTKDKIQGSGSADSSADAPAYQETDQGAPVY